MRRIVIALLIALFVGVLAILINGCSSSLSSSLTGGSIPIGDIDGQVWSSTRSLSTTQEVTVDLVSSSGKLEKTAKTDVEGRFAFHGVQQGRWLLRTQTIDKEAEIDVDVQPTLPVTVAMRLAPPPTNLDRLWLTPDGQSIDVTIGNTVQFKAWDTQGGNPTQESLPVSWAVQGRLGTISPDGLLTAQRAGAGIVVAQYGRVRTQTTVHVAPEKN